MSFHTDSISKWFDNPVAQLDIIPRYWRRWWQQTGVIAIFLFRADVFFSMRELYNIFVRL